MILIKADSVPRAGDRIEFASDRLTDKGPSSGSILETKITVDGLYVKVRHSDAEETMSWDDLSEHAQRTKADDGKTLWMIKAHVHAHQRHLSSGKVVAVREHDDKRVAKQKVSAAETKHLPDGLRALAHRVPEVANEFGYSVDYTSTSNSPGSNSFYIYLRHPKLKESVKVRVSDHNNSGGYGESIADVRRDIDIDDMAVSLAEAVGADSGAYKRRIEQRQEKAAEAVAASLQKRVEGMPEKIKQRTKERDDWLAFAESLPPNAKRRNAEYKAKEAQRDIDSMQRMLNEHNKSSPQQQAFDWGAVKKAPATDTPAFKRWFGDSKVVDDQGKPLVVYHGTNSDFEAFNVGPESGSDYPSATAWFSRDSGLANGFVRGGRRTLNRDGKKVPKGAAVYPVFLSIQKPVDVSGMRLDHLVKIDEFMEQVGLGHLADGAKSAFVESQLKKVSFFPETPMDERRQRVLSRPYPVWKLMDDDGLVSVLREAGHDGFVASEEYRMKPDGARRYATVNTKTYAVFSPGQVKSATGNSGEFDPENPSMIKAHVKQHTRTLASGKVVVVKEHEDSRKTEPNAAPWGPDAAAKIRQIMEDDDDYADFGLRVIHDGHEVKAGDKLGNSHRWEDGKRTDEELDGVSAIEVKPGKIDQAMRDINNGGYLPLGKQVALVKGEKTAWGEDAGEAVIKDAEVVAVWSVPAMRKAIPVLTRDHEPTDAQKEAGNYQVKRRRFAGLDVSIENPAGSYRRGQDRTGRTWETRMLYDYGYIRGTLGVDGDHVDCYLGPNEDAPMVYVIHQRRYGDWDKFDEDKCMLGFDSQEDAVAAYLKHYDDPRFLGPVTPMAVGEFKEKVMSTRDNPRMIKGMPLILKANVRQHTRKLKSGKVITVRGYTDKRTRKTGSTEKQMDMFDGKPKAGGGGSGKKAGTLKILEGGPDREYGGFELDGKEYVSAEAERLVDQASEFAQGQGIPVVEALRKLLVYRKDAGLEGDAADPKDRRMSKSLRITSIRAKV